MRNRRERDPRNGMIWGLFLILMGVLVLLAQRDLLPSELVENWWEWWPAVLVMVGVVQLVRPANPRDVGSGVTSILMGLWFFANFQNWFDLTWHTSWPLALVAIGAGMTARALATAAWRWAPEQEESRG